MEKIKVLLVDDDLLFGNIATKILKAADYEVYFQNSLFGIESLIMKLNQHHYPRCDGGRRKQSRENQRYPTRRRRHSYHLRIF